MNSKLTFASGSPSRMSYGKKLSLQYYMMLTLTIITALASWNHNLWLTGTMIVFSFLVVISMKMASRKRSKGLHQVVRELASGIEQVASAAAQVSSSAQSVAQGASRQAESLQETSASTEQITAMTNRNADSSRTVAETMQITAGRIDNGNHKLEEMVQSMNQITGSSEKISKIIKTIDEIAFQTNILALNAAVEAARAGEAGMGFAVVADEVRNLAQRCATAAKDTSTLIEESINRTQTGSRCLDEMAVALAGITTESEKVKTLVEEVSVGSQEQAGGLKQIATAIVSMEQLTQRTAASSEESASVGEELSAQAESLRAVIKELAKTMGAKLDESSYAAKSNYAKKSPNGSFEFTIAR